MLTSSGNCLSPYTQDQLAEIASELNVLDRQQKERRAERNAEARRAETRHVMVRTEARAANPHTFHKALKLAIAEARQTDGLLAEIQRRLAEGLLAARDLHRLLFVASSPVWDEVRQQAPV